jgi:hypothetical protein
MLESMSSRTISPALVGRAGEISRLRSAFASVREGAPAAVLIGGEAGVGKSRLIREFTAAERGAGARVLVGGSWSWEPMACRSRRSPPCCGTWCGS